MTTTAKAAEPPAAADTPLVAPSSGSGLLEVFRQRYLLRLLVRKELRARYQGSLLGLAWSYVQPAVRFTMYFLVIGFVLGLRDHIENFAIHLFAGMVMLNYFTETFGSGTRSVSQNRSLVTKVNLPREMFPVASMLVSAYHTFPQLVVLVIGCMIVGWAPDPVGLAAGLLGFVIVMLFGMALALIFSAANVFFQDFQKLVETLQIFFFWSVPMIYPFSRLTESSLGGTWVETAYLANPLAEAVLLFQRCFWVATTKSPEATAVRELPSDLWTRGFVMLGVSLLLLGLAQLIFSKLEGKFAERL